MTLPERHLGLVQTCDQATEELEKRINAGADALLEAGLSDFYDRMPVVEFIAPPLPPVVLPKSLQGHRIAVARDEAFSFIYNANLRVLEELGAELVFFSPLRSAEVPKDIDGLWLPGGYPELHASTIAQNKGVMEGIKQLYQDNKPVLAECGGFLYSLETLSDLQGETHEMLGLLKGHGAMTGRGGCQGMQAAVLPEGTVRGHAHHHSQSSDLDESLLIGHGQRLRYTHYTGEPIYQSKRLTGMYLHLFFPSNPDAISLLFQRAN
jgi:cobyrinic acid a,c-diamide synthase